MKQVILTQQLLTRTEVQQAVRLSCSSLYRLMRIGKFPNPIRLGENAVRWNRYSDEINEYLNSKSGRGRQAKQHRLTATAEQYRQPHKKIPTMFRNDRDLVRKLRHTQTSV